MKNQILPSIIILIHHALSFYGGLFVVNKAIDGPNLLYIVFLGVFSICPVVLFQMASKKAIASGNSVLEDDLSQIANILSSSFGILGASDLLMAIGLGTTISRIIATAIMVFLFFFLPFCAEAILSK